MSDLSNFFSSKLPTLSGDIGKAVDGQISYATAGIKTVLSEGYAKVATTFGDNAVFKRMSAALPSSLKSFLTPTQAKAALDKVSTSTASASSIKQEIAADDTGSNTGHKVRLVSATADGESEAIQNDVNFPVEPLMQRMVEWDNMPEVSEVHSVEYESLHAPQMPLEFQKYKGTKSVTWQVNGTFTCRTRDEALRNYTYLNILRGWTKPYFGEKQRTQFVGSGKLGAPPPVLEFSGWRSLVGKVPVVITSLNWNWPKDCDWIPTGVMDDNGKEIPFPTVMAVNVSLVESFSPDQVNGFDLVAFRNGRMVNAWLAADQHPSTPKTGEPIGGNGGNSSAIKGTAMPDLDHGRFTAQEDPDHGRFKTQETADLDHGRFSVTNQTPSVQTDLQRGVGEVTSQPAILAQGNPSDLPVITTVETKPVTESQLVQQWYALSAQQQRVQAFIDTGKNNGVYVGSLERERDAVQAKMDAVNKQMGILNGNKNG